MHIQYDETGDPARLPAQLAAWAMGKKELKYCTDNEKNILNWANYERSRQNKNRLSLHD
jgi:hypothetical protein